MRSTGLSQFSLARPDMLVSFLAVMFVLCQVVTIQSLSGGTDLNWTSPEGFCRRGQRGGTPGEITVPRV